MRPIKYNRLLVILFGAALGVAIGVTAVSCGSKTKDSTSISSTTSIVSTLSDNVNSTIEKVNYDMSKIKFSDVTVSYDGEVKSLAIEGELPEGVTVSYQNNNKTNAGVYEVIASFKGDEESHNPISDMKAKLTILKKKVSVPELDVSEFECDDTEKKPTILNLDNNMMDVSGTTSAINEGEYSINVNLKDADNYEWDKEFDGVLPWEITKPDKIVSVQYYVNGTLTKSFELKNTNELVLDDSYVTDDGLTIINWETEDRSFAPKELVKLKDDMTEIKLEAVLGKVNDDILFEIYEDEAIVTGIKNFNVDFEVPEYVRTENGFAKVVEIGDNAFTNASFETITMPDDIARIGERAFCSCSLIKTINMPSELQFVGKEAFIEIGEIGNVNIKDVNKWVNIEFATEESNPIYVANSVSVNDTLLTDLVIDKNVKQIEKYAFYGAKCFKSVTFNNRITSIGEEAFAFCEGLEEIVIPSSVETIDKKAFYACSNLSSITLGENMTTISEGLFSSCESLKSIVIPNNITNIEKEAFSECTNLEEVTLPSSLNRLDCSLFSVCSNLTSITYTGTVDEFNTLQKDSEWNEFSSISKILCNDGTITL